MYANIVLAGGGVKGPVLAGCLKAAFDKGVKPRGFGGTSAGSIVALLAAIGYTGDELKQILLDMDFTQLLDDGGQQLNALKSEIEKLTGNLQSWKGSLGALLGLNRIKGLFATRYGLYRGEKIKQFLVDKIRWKYPGLKQDARKVNFEELMSYGMLPLRLVATDLDSKRAVVFGTGTEKSKVSIVDAVLASASYPTVFDPVKIDEMWLADGGLSSNLPAFLFEKEYRDTRTPTLAFDLVPASKTGFQGAGVADYGRLLSALRDSVLEASDVLIRESTPGVSYFPIEVPDGVGTLDFDLDRAKRDHCFTKGYAEAARLLESHPSIARTKQSGGELKKTLMDHFGPPSWFEPVLRAVISQLDSMSTGELGGMRAHIMLLTDRKSSTADSTRIVTYSMGMEGDSSKGVQGDPDIDLELDQHAGCSGRAWDTRQIAVADLVEASRDPKFWSMSPEQQAKIPSRIQSMISAPIPGDLRADSAPSRPIGTISVDCEARLADTGWWNESTGEIDADVATVMRSWASVIGAMLP